MKSLFELLYPTTGVLLVRPQVKAYVGDRLKSRFKTWEGSVWEILDIEEDRILLTCLHNSTTFNARDQSWFSEWNQFILESDTQPLK